jgi:hypothetical protein
MRKQPANPGKRPPAMRRVAEELKPMLEFLERELTSWPHVTAKPMFGMLGFYRRQRIFAALPRTRALGTPHAILCKLPHDKQPGRPGKGWKTVEVFSDQELRKALDLLNRAYEQAAGKKK